MKINDFLVTVYITNFNYARYIRQSIESVLHQTLTDFELLIIDDGSTDDSRNIIEQYRSVSNVTIIYQQNKGLNVTNNIAMRAARGKYIMRLDADDYIEPNALELMSSSLEKDGDLGLVFPDYFYVDSHGVVTGEEKRHNFEEEVSLYDQPAHGACTMIRLSFLKQLGGYNESFVCQDGYDLWIKFITHHKVTNINKPLFYYRRHDKNLTRDELKILSTRKKIKELFVDEHFNVPQTLAVIPVRNTWIGGLNWPLVEIKGKSILEWKVQACVSARRVHTIIISASDKEIIDHCKGWVGEYPHVYIIERPQEYAKSNETLAKTFQQAIAHVKGLGTSIDALMSISLEYPFVDADVLDDAVNTLALFRSDAVLSVRPDNRTYYQHTGHTLKAILDQDKFTKLERESLYQAAGGIAVSTLKNFERNQKLVSGSISHIVVDQKTAFGVFSEFDMSVVRAIYQEY